MARPNSAKLMLFGAAGVEITPNDSSDLATTAKAVCVISIEGGSNLSIVPTDNDDGDTIDFVGVSVGFVPPYQVRRVMSTGTTCTVASVDG